MYELFYWPSIQGRGEPIRLALEDAGAAYVDVARSADHGGVAAMRALMAGEAPIDGPLPFAPPFLRDGEVVIAHAANILHYLGPRLGLAPDDETGRLHAHQLQLSIADFYGEVHDTHHPLGSSLYYEDQKPEARRRALVFVRDRLPKFLGYFEREVARGDGHPIRRKHGYVDLSLFQIVEGLTYAFPRATAAIAPEIPRLLALHARVAERPNVAAYLVSKRRLPFNEHGIFRRYPELDLVPGDAP